MTPSHLSPPPQSFKSCGSWVFSIKPELLFIITNDTFNECHCLCDGSTKRSWNHIHLIATNSLVSSFSVKGSGEVTVFFSVMLRCESVKKLCTCVKHLQRFQLKANMFFFPFNIVLDDYDILLSQSYIWWWWPLNWRLLYVKNNKCFMIHGCVSYCDCVVHVNGLPHDTGKQH